MDKLSQSSVESWRPKYIYIQGYFISMDKFGRAKIMFLDDYDLEENDIVKNSAVKNEIQMSFTKRHLLKKNMRFSGYSPIIDNDTCFYVKCRNLKVGYKNSVPCPITELIQHKVEIHVDLKTYNFKKNGERNQGWYIDLKKITLLEL